jgi:signal transduction histidine kinase
MVVDEQDSLGHLPLIGIGGADLKNAVRRPQADAFRVFARPQSALADCGLTHSRTVAEKRGVEHFRSQSYRSWLVGEVLLVGLLASGTGLFAISESLRSAYELPETRLVLDTAAAVVAGIVAVLASVRFRVDGRTLDLLVAGGFWSIALGTTVFGLIPVLGGEPLPPWAAWALVGARLLGAALIAIAPWTNARLSARQPALVAVGVGIVAILAAAGFGLQAPDWGVDVVEGSSVMRAAALLAVLWLVALVGFAVRYRRHGRDFDSWMCLSVTLGLFAELHLLLTPVVSSDQILLGDFLRLVAYGVLLVGVWRAIADAEFGRAVADERARVARDIHDGLAQYLFAITTQVSMLESGGSLEQVLPRLKRASVAAQQEARFAVLALSSAGGTARFDSALRRYVDVLTADGELDVELDVDGSVRLAPDEQIEVFRIVQEGLGNARRHAGARHVEVAISQRAGRRVVSVRDDGMGFDEATATNGQGLANMRLRAEAIEGRLSLSSAPGRGTAIEVVLRPT